MNKRRRFNHICSLKLEDGSWCYDEDKIKQEVISFYRRLYTEDGTACGAFRLRNAFPLMDVEWVFVLSKDVSSQEVHDALFEMAPLKAPGIDGLHAQFYQS